MVSLEALPPSLLEIILDYHPIALEPLRKRQRQPSETLPTAAQLYVKHLPGLAEDSRVKLFAGHLPAYNLQLSKPSEPADPHLFFLLARAKHISDRPRVVFWFNGGPGCSSLDGALMEIGPLRVHAPKDGPLELVEAPHSWSEYTDVVFIDQPAGTGLSFINHGKPVHELTPAATQVADFLQNFYKVFPEFLSSDTYLAGESYAGMYIPYIADALRNAPGLDVQLKGLLMGNPWIDPRHQYPSYIEYAYEKKLLEKGSKDGKLAEQVNDQCNDILEDAGENRVLIPKCEAFSMIAQAPGCGPPDRKSMCRNAYNIDLVTECGVEYPPGAGVAADFLHQSDVIGAFHALHKLSEWAQCNETIADQMWSPHSRPSAQLLPDLLQDMPVLIYAGELDLMCNYIGLESAIEHLQWGGLTGLANTTSSTWTVDGREIGSWRTRDKLSFVRLANASHMVMLEEPAAAHDMLLRFTGIDTLMAAGPSAQVPSRLGPFNGTEVVLGKLTPQGAALVDSEPGDEGTSVHQSDGQEEEEEHDKEREARYGPRRFAVLALLVLLAGVMMAVGLRWMSKQRRQRQIHRARSRKGKGRASEESIALVKEEGRRLRKDAAELEALIFRNSES